ncbi:MAG: lipid-A-disaccharide synthase N-terminal domain-containing protein [Phycisphaerae bacterium]|nr:lipid-A-disaccharide synthase N-terminal domain-containing protein [Phycisphaerae bacterium]
MIAVFSNLLIAQAPADGVLNLTHSLEAMGLEHVTPGWLIFGLCAPVLLVACLVVQLIASRRRHMLTIPPAVGYLGTIATLMLLLYAARHHYLVFVIAQFVNTLICLRLMMLIRRAQDKLKYEPGTSREEQDSGFPIVSPDSAELKIPLDED